MRKLGFNIEMRRAGDRVVGRADGRAGAEGRVVGAEGRAGAVRPGPGGRVEGRAGAGDRVVGAEGRAGAGGRVERRANAGGHVEGREGEDRVVEGCARSGRRLGSGLRLVAGRRPSGGAGWRLGSVARLSTGARLILGLVATAVLYALYKLWLCDPRFLSETSRGFRHFLKFGIALLVYGLGVLAFYRNSQGWVMPVWHFLYAGMLVLLTILGIFDAVGGGLPEAVRALTTTLFEFLISPVPLVVLVVVSRAMERATKET